MCFLCLRYLVYRQQLMIDLEESIPQAMIQHRDCQWSGNMNMQCLILLIFYYTQMQHLLSTVPEPLGESSRIIYSIVIFVNGESGGKHGQELTNSKIKGIQMDENYSSFLYFFKINELPFKKKGLTFIQTLTKTVDHAFNRIVVLAGGGDGTVNWLLSELIEAKINFNQIIFGAFPLGTGNDFAKNLGWNQYRLFESGFEQLQEFLQKIRYSRVQNFDVWEVVVECREGGYIAQSMSGTEKKIPDKPLIKQITNYFSFGMDARVGYDFDSHRSNFQFFNYALYCLIGCFNRFKQLPSVEKVVTNMQQSQSEAEDAEEGRMNLIFKSEEERLRLKKFRNIVALNINSYMGGVSGVWQYSKQSQLKSQSASKYAPNNHSDGLLEFVAFKDQWSLGFQRFFRGRARKIAQGRGPFKFQFDANCALTYLNFDGEYYKISQPKCIIVRASPHFSQTKLRVLRCPTTLPR